MISEIPDVLSNFQRNKYLHDILLYSRGLFYMSIATVFAGILFTKARESVKRDRAREAEILGFDMPVSATYKNSKYKGRAVEGMEGWIDMSRDPDGLNDDEDENDDDEED